MSSDWRGFFDSAYAMSRSRRISGNGGGSCARTKAACATASRRMGLVFIACEHDTPAFFLEKALAHASLDPRRQPAGDARCTRNDRLGLGAGPGTRSQALHVSPIRFANRLYAPVRTLGGRRTCVAAKVSCHQ